jgi:two-component system, NarL family, nitrate/nitrite response regulator NarL
VTATPVPCTRRPVAAASSPPRADVPEVIVLVPSEVMRQGVCALLHRMPVAAGAASRPRVDVVVAATAGPAGTPQEPLRRDGPPRQSAGAVLLVLEACRVPTVPIAELAAVRGVLLAEELSAASIDDALRSLACGHAVLPPALMTRLVAEAARGPAGQEPGSAAQAPPGWPALLTAREHRALVLLADGLGNKQIARALGVSSDGAKRLVSAVLLKLGVGNRTAAVAQGARLGLIELAGRP